MTEEQIKKLEDIAKQYNQKISERDKLYEVDDYKNVWEVEYELRDLGGEMAYIITEDREICEGCNRSVPLSDMSGVMEMYICNKCEEGA